MHRRSLWWILPVVLGGLLLLTTPPDATFSVGVSEASTVPADESPVAFETLSADEQATFEAALDGQTEYAEEPAVHYGYVEYEGTVYEMSLSAGEGNVLALVQPWIGVLCLAIGGGFLLYQRRSRSQSVSRDGRNR